MLILIIKLNVGTETFRVQLDRVMWGIHQCHSTLCLLIEPLWVISKIIWKEEYKWLFRIHRIRLLEIPSIIDKVYYQYDRV